MNPRASQLLFVGLLAVLSLAAAVSNSFDEIKARRRARKET